MPEQDPLMHRVASRVRSWRRLGRARGLVAAAVALLAALGAHAGSAVDRCDEIVFDVQARFVRALRAGSPPPSPQADVVLVGIDGASLDALRVPMALMHATLGTALQAIAAGAPAAIGLDVALPERSFDHLMPELDRELMRGLRRARDAAGIAVALDIDESGRLRVPAPALLAAAGGTPAFGLPLFPIDCDGSVRRFDPDPARIAVRDGSHCGRHAQALFGAGVSEGRVPALPTFAALVARQIRLEARLERPGWIDFTRGEPFSYIPVRDVVQWYEAGDLALLHARFGGQVVLLGSVLPFLDRLPMPGALAGWEVPGTSPPGVIVNAQLLRNALGAGLLRSVPDGVRIALVLAMALLAFCGGSWTRWIFLAGALALATCATTALHAAGWFLAPAGAMFAGCAAVACRGALDLAQARSEREHLARAFGGYLSPQLLRAILEGRPAAQVHRRAIALLFADLRDFTRWSESADPALVLDTLNRYYATVTPLLHAHGGTIDNFRGDGIMVMFGAPEDRDRPCEDAFAAARGMLEQVERLNRSDLLPNAMPALELSIGLAYGEVVFGDLGSEERKDFTALGDAVNVAARLQDLAKLLGYPVLMTRAFALLVPDAVHQARDLGAQALKGHTPVEVCGWRTDDRSQPRRREGI